jgi:DNA modification methylase/REP element-mobilizing transposase RayT
MDCFTGSLFPGEEKQEKEQKDEFAASCRPLAELLDSVRHVEGFPLGRDEDILALSDPPYYTACPNPYIGEFIKFYGKPYDEATDTYERTPYVSDVSEGKNDPVYNAHSYHTKVPHKAIMKYIEHYTEEGDLVFDGFCGSGMTGVAAQLLGRRAILGDLSPAATFIAYNYNAPVDVAEFEREAKRILREVEKECGWMYETFHSEAGILPAKKDAGWKPAPLTEFKQTERDLPHWQHPGAIFFVTFNIYQRKALSAKSRDIVMEAVKYWDGSKIYLFSAVVMPDHVHMLFKLLTDKDGNSEELSKVMHSIKSYSANQVNKEEGWSGILWQNESYDHIIRDEADFNNTLNYIYYNPINKGLVLREQPYPWYMRHEALKDAGWKPAPLGRINYTVWSDVFICPYCGSEYVFWEAAVDKEKGKVLDKYPCSSCGAVVCKRDCRRATVTIYDQAIGQEVTQAKQVPVLINYTVKQASSLSSKRFEKTPDAFDLALIKKIEESAIPYWFPTDRMPEGYNTEQPKRSHGITHVHHFYTKRNLWVLAGILNRIIKIENQRVKKSLFFGFNNVQQRHCIMNTFRFNVSFPSNITSGTLYIPSMVKETNTFDQFENKYNRRLLPVFKTMSLDKNATVASFTASATADIFRNNFCDYIFTDPPFGSNLMYSELNFLWEAWLKVFTNNQSEAIINNTQHKGLPEYKELMTACFKEMYRILKPNRWMTVVFHNSKASVWNAIQEAMTKAGFVVAQVTVMDRKQGSFKQVTSAGAVKNDLIINAYKPKKQLEDNFLKKAGVGLERDFVADVLEHLPVEPNIGRTEQMLYSKVLAHYVQRGYEIRLDARQFYTLLKDNFKLIDGYWFTGRQILRYAEWKRKQGLAGVKEIKSGQQILFVCDEKSALAWFYEFLESPQAYTDIYTAYSKNLTAGDDAIPELRELLENNFIFENGHYRRPQTGQEKEAIAEKREKELARAFERLLTEAGSGAKKIKGVRKEAVISGFTKAYQEKRFSDILAVAGKMDRNLLETNGEINDFVEIARLKTGEGL